MRRRASPAFCIKVSRDTDPFDLPRSRSEAMSAAWALLDADNTLWHVEPLYDRARARLVQLLADQGADAHAADAFQRKRDAQIFETLGYSDKRFEQSFVDTLHHCAPRSAGPQVERKVRALARGALSSPAEVDPDAEQAIDLLRRYYKLGMITAGDRHIQQRRIKEFPYIWAFDAIRCVPAKTTDVFDRFCVEHGVDRSRSVVIGDSLRSDILPAIKAGLTPIWVRNPNWHAVENQSAAPAGVTAADRLLEAAQAAVGNRRNDRRGEQAFSA